MNTFTPNTVADADKVNENFTGLANGTEILDDAIGNNQLALGVPVQMVGTAYTDVATGTTIIPRDDTIPQNTEGTEFMTQAITPKSTTNILVIDVVFQGGISIANDIIMALFQDSTANAIAAADVFVETVNGRVNFTLRHIMVAGTTSSTTFKLRCGPVAAGTVTFNGASSARNFGAITKSSILITEYKAS